MGYGAVHRPHAISFPGTPIVYVTQFTDATANNNYQEFVERSAAEPAPQWTGAIGAAPELSFTSRQLKDILDLTTEDDVAVSYAPAGGTVAIYYRKGKNRGLREAVASAVHDRWDMANNACLYWNSLSASQRDIAQLECVLKAVSTDGATAPMVHVGSTALSGDSAVSHVYTLGPISINGAWVDSVASTRIDNGFTFDEYDESGNAYQQYFGIDEHNPTITIETDDLSVFDDFGEAGLACTSVKQYFRKLNKGSIGTVAEGTAEHISITGTSGTILVQEGSGMKARHRVTITMSKPDASTQPFVVNTATAITT